MREARIFRRAAATVIAVLLGVVGTVATGGAAHAAELISNPSAELGTTTPTNWISGGFGTNTRSFTWSTNGHTGSRSLRVDISAYTSGDAKWYFSSVPVTPNTQYTYSFWTRSTVLSQVNAQYRSSTGVVTNKWLADIPASPAAWTQQSTTFSTPAGVTSMTMFDLIGSVGTLELDDVSLPEPTIVPLTQLVVNPGTEEGVLAPTYWLTGGFGTNTRAFTWSTNGHTGGRSLRIDVSAFTSGDAKWYFTPVTVTPNTQYTYTYWSRSTVIGQINAQYKNAAGVLTTKWLADIPAAPGVWTQRTKTFTTPADAVSMTIFHLIGAVGSLEIDDVSLPPGSVPAPPAAAVTSPIGGATVSGTAVALTATTTGTGILGVRFAIDGIPVGAEDTTAPYSASWDTTLYVNGAHNITATVRNAITATTSPTVSVTLANAPTPELTSNGSLETANGSSPASWVSDHYGVNDAAFSYPATGGHNGSRFARASITSWSSGDAKWQNSTALAATPGTTYRYTDWYRSAGPTEVLAQIGLADGTFSFSAIGEPPAASTWTRYTGVITMPATAVSVILWHSLLGVGFVETDDYSFKVELATRFIRPLVTLTFDDGHASDASVALPALQQNSLTGTFYLVTGYLGTPDYITSAGALQLRDGGMEIGAHTVTHSDLVTLTDAQQQAELANSKSGLEALIGRPVPNFASPFGSYNAAVLSKIKAIYGSHRSTRDGYNLRTTTDVYEMKRQTVTPATTVADVAGWVSQAQANGTWLIIVFHDISDTPSVSGTSPALFNQMMQTVKGSGVTVTTIAGALAEVTPQLTA